VRHTQTQENSGTHWRKKNYGFSLYLGNTFSEAYLDTRELGAHWSEKRWVFPVP